MFKKLINYIFIMVVLSGCDILCVDCYTPTYDEENDFCDSGVFLDVEAPSLNINSNGFYELHYLQGSNQTFATLDAYTGSVDTYQKVGWISNKEVQITTQNGSYWVNCVNSSSYTDTEGEAHTVLSAWEILIGDTITVYAGYSDEECLNDFSDSLKVIILGE